MEIEENIDYRYIDSSIDEDHGAHRNRRRLSSGTSYRSDMPARVLAYLEKDNAADIELYKFALDEYERRQEDELWLGTHYHNGTHYHASKKKVNMPSGGGYVPFNN